MENEIVIKELVKNFDDVQAVNGLNFEIRKGELFSILGPNGLGKLPPFGCCADCWLHHPGLLIMVT